MEWFNREGTLIAANKVHSIKGESGAYTIPKICHRCGGGGGAEKWRHTGWTCWECSGSKTLGLVNFRVYSSEKLAKLNASQAVRAAKRLVLAQEKSRKQAQEAADWWSTILKDEEQKPFWLALQDLATFMPLADSILQKGKQNRGLTEAQKKLVIKLQQRQEKQNQNLKSNFIGGNPGSRIETEVTCEKIIKIGENQYRWGSYIYLLLLRDNSGNVLCYKGSPFMDEGQTFKIKATVKDYQTFNGVKQTVISRPKLVD